jgi:hypothetical protein
MELKKVTWSYSLVVFRFRLCEYMTTGLIDKEALTPYEVRAFFIRVSIDDYLCW